MNTWTASMTDSCPMHLPDEPNTQEYNYDRRVRVSLPSSKDH